MDRPVTTEIDPGKCIGCGRCVEVCPSDTLALVNGVAEISGTVSLQCGHCAAICPTQAIAVRSLDPEAWVCSSFDFDPEVPTPDRPHISQLVSLMAMRRSCRAFSDQPVAPGILEDLVRVATMAPTGTNSQDWTFHLVGNRDGVRRVGAELARFFEQLNKIASLRAVRLVSRLLPGDPVGMYYRQYKERAEEALAEWRNGGRDRLFHGAPALILVGSRGEGTLPKEDAALASQNVLLACEALGLGSCLIGFAVEAMKAKPVIKSRLGLPAKEKFYSVIAVGHPKHKFQRPAGRLNTSVEWLD